jgi:acyl-CoA thioesterase-2
VPPPEGIADESWSKLFERRWISDRNGRVQAWLRVPDTAGTADPVVAACALAFLSDDLATDAVRSQRQGAEGGELEAGWRWRGISLDHAIWFQGPAVAGDWQLHDFRCDGLSAPRGLSVGHVFGGDGTHLATVTQEVLLRPSREED